MASTQPLVPADSGPHMEVNSNPSALEEGCRQLSAGDRQLSAGRFQGVRQASGNLTNSGSPEQLTLEWDQVSFKIGDKQILQNITGLVRPGRLTGVLGPSGSGKSTLLNVLAGRQRTNAPGMELKGDIRASGVKINPSDFRSNIAYVMQDDSILATESPRECLEFSAYLRLPGRSTAEQRSQLVEKILTSLNLQKCATTLVGSALVKGISGGERKRTAVGVELITSPKLFFLDEPLSGLDSYAAYTLVETLKDLANDGVPVLCTVHQPSSEIFDMFDDVCFLHDGEVTYHGPVTQLPQYFTKLGYPCKESFNPADHVMFVLQKESQESIRKIKDEWQQSILHKDVADEVERCKHAAAGNGKSFLRDIGSARVGFFRELGLLTKREIRATLRNKGILGARYGMAIFLAGLYAWLFAGSASNGDDKNSSEKNCVTGNFDATACGSDFQAHYGTLVSLAIMAMMGSAQPVLLSFPNERPVFLREYAAKQYGVIPYFISKTLVEMPVVLVGQIITFLIAYWIMGLKGNMLGLIGIMWALGIASSSLALLIGCGVASAQKAIQLAPLALIPQMLFSGLFVPVSKIPPSLRWVKYICPLKYAISLLGIVEFDYVHTEIEHCMQKLHSQDLCEVAHPGAYVQQTGLKNQSVQWDDFWQDLCILLALLVVFRIMSAFLLWKKGKYVY